MQWERSSDENQNQHLRYDVSSLVLPCLRFHVRQLDMHVKWDHINAGFVELRFLSVTAKVNSSVHRRNHNMLM